MAWSAYRTWVAGDPVLAAELNQDIRDNGNIIAAVGITSWASYTPTLTGSGSNPTGTTYAGGYAQVGKLVAYRFSTVLGAGVGTGTYSWATPVTLRSAFTGWVGTIKCIDSGTTEFMADLEAVTTTTLQAYMSYDGKTGTVTQTNPMTAVTGDSFRGGGFLEAA